MKTPDQDNYYLEHSLTAISIAILRTSIRHQIITILITLTRIREISPVMEDSGTVIPQAVLTTLTVRTVQGMRTRIAQETISGRRNSQDATTITKDIPDK